MSKKIRTKLSVLVACEFSGTVRDVFAKRGWDAWSCDLLPSETPGNHIQGDALMAVRSPWDLVIAHPPCTYLANSGARFMYYGGKKENGLDLERREKMLEGAKFFRLLHTIPGNHVAVENPIMLGVAKKAAECGEPTQVIQPWMFGHGETKATCLWLRGLPNLVPTNIVDGREQRLWKLPPSENRWKLRSKTYQGIADAMAVQWGKYLEDLYL